MNPLDITAIDLEAWAAASAAALDDDERRRASRFRSVTARRRFIAAHIGLRHVLARALDCPSRDVPIARAACHRCGGPHGRPELAGGGPPYFSLSHSGELALVAVCRDAPVGVDVEARRPVDVPLAVAARVATPGELEVIGACPAPSSALLAMWVRKEAVVKATGEGIAAAAKYRVLDGAPDGWRIAAVDAGPGYAAAVAVRTPSEALVGVSVVVAPAADPPEPGSGPPARAALTR